MNRKKGFTLVELLVTIAIICVIVGVATPIILAQINKNNDAENDSPNSENNPSMPDMDNEIEQMIESLSRADLEKTIINFMQSEDKLDFNYYRNNAALQHLLDVQGDISHDDQAIVSWTDDVLKARAKIILINIPKMELRQDKVQLKSAVDAMKGKNILEDERYSEADKIYYNQLLNRANTLVNNLDAADDSVTALKNEINIFMTKYD